MSHRDYINDEQTDVDNATVLEGAGVEIEPGFQFTPTEGPGIAATGSWNVPGPVGIPAAHTSQTNEALPTANLAFSGASMSQYAPHAYEPSVVSSSYRSTASGSFHTPQTGHLMSQSASRSSSVPGFTKQPLTSFQWPATMGTQFSGSASSIGQSYGVPTSQSQSYIQPSTSYVERTKSYSVQPPSRQGSVGTIDYAQEAFFSPPNARRSLLSSMLAQQNATTRKRTDTSPYSRPSSRASSRRGSFQRMMDSGGYEEDVYPPAITSPSIDPHSSSSFGSVGFSTEPRGPVDAGSHQSGLQFVPSHSFTTTDVSKTIVSTRTRVNTWKDPAKQVNDLNNGGPARPPPSNQQFPINERASLSPLAQLGDSTGKPLQLPSALNAILKPIPNTASLDLATHPVSEILDMMADVLSEALRINDALYGTDTRGTALRTPEMRGEEGRALRNTLLSFHSYNIPVIELRAYLSRILKYCPITGEVFIALLVYFDRLTRHARSLTVGPLARPGETIDGEPGTSANLFVLDSYNIHRLIIAGVTVASKFFSDIFYKNSRYAKVGGLPVEELNHLELQFLILLDFKLMVTPEELQQYANFLASSVNAH